MRFLIIQFLYKRIHRASSKLTIRVNEMYKRHSQSYLSIIQHKCEMKKLIHVVDNNRLIIKGSNKRSKCIKDVLVKIAG